MSRELLQQALDALEVATTPLAKDRQEVLRAQAALRSAIAAPQPEPVAYVPRCHTDGNYCIVGEYKWDEIEEKPFGLADPAHWECAALYAAAPPAAPDIVNPITPAGMVMVPREPTPEMLAAYLAANTQYWKEVDELPRTPTTKWRQGTPSDATRESYRAMIAAAPAPAVPLTREQHIAIREAHCNTASSEYFGARPSIDSLQHQRAYEAGFKEGWESAHGIGGGGNES